MGRFLLYFLLSILVSSAVCAREYHVSVKGSDKNEGSAAKPFKTINFAAQLAKPGDVITVHEGTYREWINPARGGESDSKRIVYRAAKGEKVEIKGSEVITGWKREKEGVWKVTIPNSFFGAYNPYKDSVYGDWFTSYGRIHHTGDVFLNGKSLFEMAKIEKVFNPEANTKIKDPEGSSYTWYCESDDQNTTIWANFHQFDPTKELVEISARRTCFYPDRPGINYLTIQGFDVSQAATQWAAPTAEQVGMISTHWNKGWIIENNAIHDSRCNGITLGKERGTGHNVWSANRSLDGSLHYIETVFKTLRNGWSKEKIGSHIVRNNVIFNCEQTGICGSMGAAFSIVENNHIYNIWAKRQFAGAEIGGIKFHGAIDTKIEKNHIHGCGRGIWLDWMAQGARVSRNLLYENDVEDLFMEVNHGPILVDNNLLLSRIAINQMSQGSAIVHNLIAGQLYTRPEMSRYTPYHLPHSTDVAGLSTIFSGDDRYYNNIFLGLGPELKAGDKRYNYGPVGYQWATLPTWVDGNIYFGKALPYKDEINKTEIQNTVPEFNIINENGKTYLNIIWSEKNLVPKTSVISTELLGKAKMPNVKFENTDGTPILIDRDYTGNVRSKVNPTPGPFEGIKSEKLRVW